MSVYQDDKIGTTCAPYLRNKDERLPTEKPNLVKLFVFLFLFSAHKFTSIHRLIFFNFGTFYIVKADTKPALKKIKRFLTKLFCFTDFVEGIYILNH